jgi:hypothetical protein
MNAKLISNDAVNKHSFQVTIDDVTYNVLIYTNEKGKFVDEEVILNGEEVEDNELVDSILDYIDTNWDKLV